VRTKSAIAVQVFALLASAVLLDVSPAAAQSNETFTGTVASSTRDTLVVRNADGQYRLYVFERGARRPATPVGSQVRVSSYPADEPGIHTATAVTILQGAPAAGAGGQAAEAPVVPAEVRRTERAIARQVRRFQAGVRAGVALDPELVMIGVHAQVGPFFSPDVFLRPNVEFAYGEVTALFGLNLEAIYRLPISARTGRWSAYVGAGPGFNFIHRKFETPTGSGSRIDFGDFHSDTGLNILGGLRWRSGVFTELKTSVYANTAPTLRLIVGYNF
jgi:hypothetical protein